MLTVSAPAAGGGAGAGAAFTTWVTAAEGLGVEVKLVVVAGRTKILPVMLKRLVSRTLTPGPPTLGPLRRKKLVPKGLPVMPWAIAGWPMNPAGGADVASHLTNGPTLVLVRRLAKLQGAARHPWSLVKLMVPVPAATKDWVPYGDVIV